MRVRASGRTAWLFGLILTLAAVPVIPGVALPGQAASRGADAAPASRPAQRVAGQYTDVTDPGLVRALEALQPTGALEAFPGEQFRSSRAVTLQEFARAATRAFGVTVPPGGDAGRAALQALVERGAWSEQEGGADPVDLALPVRVGPAADAVLRLAGMGPVYERWPSQQGGSPGLELAQAAGILPESVKADDAARPMTRGELVQMLYEARRVSAVRGTLRTAAAGTAQIETELGSVRVRLADDAVVVRNGRPASRQELADGDDVVAVVDLAGRARVVAASGGLALGVDPERLVATARQALEAFVRELTPEQWQMLLQGDWEGFKASAMPQVYDRLTEAGIAPWEADALLNGDWASLRSLAADRLAQEAGRRLAVSPDLVRSVLDSDWATARQLAQQELIERIINDVIVPNARRQGAAG